MTIQFGKCWMKLNRKKGGREIMYEDGILK
jgi:hypothetical protein